MAKSKSDYGKSTFKEIEKAKNKNRSPTPKPKQTPDELKIQVEFCEKELKIHRENENNIMIAYKLEEIINLKRKLKNV